MQSNGAPHRRAGPDEAWRRGLLPATPVLDPKACRLDDFRTIVEVETSLGDYPHARRIDQGAVVYDLPALIADVEAKSGRAPSADPAIRTEIATALSEGPGMVVLAQAFDRQVVARASEVFFQIIADEQGTGGEVGDHFAEAGANDRIWNALEKLAVADPEVYVDYYANEGVALGALSWLGPAYAVTSQVNVVNPGGTAQVPHRDYHLGFMTEGRAAEYPAHAHRASPTLTLQGAVAHCDMEVETGPTKYLPGSHRYELGYLAWRQPDFVDYFAANHVQLPLALGDLVLFNPALFHGAGENRTTDVRRMANLLQISSPMGIPIETVDRARMVLAVYDSLASRLDGGVDPLLVGHAAAATAHGYAFPTNLDRDQPVDGLTPPSQLDLLVDALQRKMSAADLGAAMDSHAMRRVSY